MNYKIKVTCNGCGDDYDQRASAHLAGQECKGCASKKNGAKRKKTKEQFIEEAIARHGFKYDYSDMEYVNKRTKGKILCKLCGEVYYQTPQDHLHAVVGCPPCSMVRSKESINKSEEDFIKEAILRYGTKYDYSDMDYETLKSDIRVSCNKCYETFEVNAKFHLNGHECPCSQPEMKHDKQAKTREQFIEEAKAIHGDDYDYSLAKYVNNSTRIVLICNTCGNMFELAPSDHLRKMGCRPCSRIKGAEKARVTKEEFVARAVAIHGNDFSYEKVIYTGMTYFVTIICNACGEEFEQRPDSHLRFGACQYCRVMSLGEKIVYKLLQELGIAFKFQFKLYSLYNRRFDFAFEYKGIKYIFEFDGAQHFRESNFFKITLEQQHQIDIEKTKAAIAENIRVIRMDYSLDKSEIKERLTWLLSIDSEFKVYCSDPEMYDWLIKGCDLDYIDE